MRQVNFRKCSKCTFQWNISMQHKQMEEHKISYFSSKTRFKTILRMENIGKIYHNHKILNCDMIQAPEQDF